MIAVEQSKPGLATASATLNVDRIPDTRSQMLDIALNTIAGYASTQRRLAMMLGGRDFDEEFQDDVAHAVEILAATIGGLADELSGKNIHGGNSQWHFGPVFGQLEEGGAT